MKEKIKIIVVQIFFLTNKKFGKGKKFQVCVHHPSPPVLIRLRKNIYFDYKPERLPGHLLLHPVEPPRSSLYSSSPSSSYSPIMQV